MLIMTARISGSRNGEDWPAVGQPAPADLDNAEIESLLAIGHIAEAEPSGDNDRSVDLETLTVAQLRALAEERGVELQGVRKAEIIAELDAAAAAAGATANPPAA